MHSTRQGSRKFSSHESTSENGVTKETGASPASHSSGAVKEVGLLHPITVRPKERGGPLRVGGRSAKDGLKPIALLGSRRLFRRSSSVLMDSGTPRLRAG